MTSQPGAQPATVPDVAVDAHGLVIPEARGRASDADRENVVDVSFDGMRVWSFHLLRDGRLVEAGILVPWPRALRRHLDGSTTLALVRHATGEQIVRREVTFGSGTGRVTVVDDVGHPMTVDKSGRLVRMFGAGGTDDVGPLLDSLSTVLSVMNDELHIPAFLAYGTLLGAVREQGIIAHDSDVDVGYLSGCEHPVDVVRESFRIERAIQARGFETERYSGAAVKVLVPETGDFVRSLDVFGGFMFDGRLHLMGEIRVPYDRRWVVPLARCRLEGRTFPAPADPERLLTVTYGPGWRVPDPAFQFDTPTSTKRRLNGWFRGLSPGRDRWRRQYALQPPDRPAEPTPFARWVSDLEGPMAEVVDLGCGDGRDTLWFARRGGHAVGADFMGAVAYGPAKELAEQDGLDCEFTYLNVASMRSSLASAALWAAATTERPTVYARFLVDALAPHARPYLWRLARTVLRRGGRMYLAFLEPAPSSGGAKVTPERGPFARRNLLTPVPADAVVAEAEAAGGRVVHRETQPGPNPGRHLHRTCRMVVEWCTDVAAE